MAAVLGLVLLVVVVWFFARSPRGESVATTASAPGISLGAKFTAVPVSYVTPSMGSWGFDRLTEM